MNKRVRPTSGYFEKLENFKIPRERKLKPQRETLSGEYFVEKLLAKKKKGNETQYLVKWQDWEVEDYGVPSPPKIQITTFNLTIQLST